MILSPKDLIGVLSMPSTKQGVIKWLKRENIPLWTTGNRFNFNLSDLPAPKRRAYYEHQIENANLPAGIYDETAHDAYLTAPAAMQETAERKVGIARLLLAIPSGAIWRERLEIVRKQFGDKGTSKLSLMRVLRAIEGVDPINFAPALLAGHTGRTATAEISAEAWDTFLALVKKTAPTHSLAAVFEDIAEIAPKHGWAWPSQATINRRWNRLDRAERLTLRHGAHRAAKEMYQSHRRDPSKLSSL